MTELTAMGPELDAAYRGDWRRVRTSVDGQTCLPTVAEEFQRLLDGNRRSFLRNFAKIISRQEKEAAPPAIHDMLARLDPPWLVVSTTYDLLLERRLENENLPFVVVTHVLRDLLPDGTSPVNGKICML